MASKSKIAKREAEVNEILTSVCKDQWKSVSMTFQPFRDLKLNWVRTPVAITLNMSDYLIDAPNEVIKDMAEFLLGKICGNKVEYPDSLRAYVTAPEFAKKNQRTYLERSGSMGSEGMHIDLKESVKRLKAMGIVPKKNKTKVVWGNECGDSVLMNVVVMDKSLDRKGVPDIVVDWLVYKHLCDVLIGFIPERNIHDREYDRAIDLFSLDKREEADWWLSHNIL